MKAILYNQYGSPDVLKLKEIDKPVPNKDEVLVRVSATAPTSRIQEAAERLSIWRMSSS